MLLWISCFLGIIAQFRVMQKASNVNNAWHLDIRQCNAGKRFLICVQILLPENKRVSLTRKRMEKKRQMKLRMSTFVSKVMKTTRLKTHESLSNWIMDFGATRQVCYDRLMYTELASITPFKIILGDQTALAVIFNGAVQLTLSYNGNMVLCKLNYLLFVPSMWCHLWYVNRFTRENLTVQISESGCLIMEYGI